MCALQAIESAICQGSGEACRAESCQGTFAAFGGQGAVTSEATNGCDGGSVVDMLDAAAADSDVNHYTARSLQGTFNGD